MFKLSLNGQDPLPAKVTGLTLSYLYIDTTKADLTEPSGRSIKEIPEKDFSETSTVDYIISTYSL